MWWVVVNFIIVHFSDVLILGRGELELNLVQTEFRLRMNQVQVGSRKNYHFCLGHFFLTHQVGTTGGLLKFYNHILSWFMNSKSAQGWSARKLIIKFSHASVLPSGLGRSENFIEHVLWCWGEDEGMRWPREIEWWRVAMSDGWLRIKGEEEGEDQRCEKMKMEWGIIWERMKGFTGGRSQKLSFLLCCNMLK